MNELESIYLNKIIPILNQEFKYTKRHKIPKIIKVVISRGFDESCKTTKILEYLLKELQIISGQIPIINNAKKTISEFKTKKGTPVGMSVTLRKNKMYDFLIRFINLYLPRIQDFRGFNKNGFDGFGNYNFGIHEQNIFPEIEFNKIIKNKGMNISIVTTAKTDIEAFLLLKNLGIPFH